MTVEIKGKIKLIGELQTFDSGFTKLQIVVSEDSQYPNDIPVDFLKDKTDYLQNFNIGDNVVVNANIKGSEYNGKYYVGLTAWTIKKELNDSAPRQERPQANQSNSFVDEKDFKEEEHDDLPF